MLLVVDMQYGFWTSKKVAHYVAERIKKSIRNKEWIMFLEYHEEGATLSQLRKLVRDYPRKTFVKKYEDSGAYEVIRAMELKGIRTPEIRVCGVNTDACVKKTVFGLASAIDTKITVLEQLCASGTVMAHNRGIRFMRKIRGLEVK